MPEVKYVETPFLLSTIESPSNEEARSMAIEILHLRATIRRDAVTAAGVRLNPHAEDTQLVWLIDDLRTRLVKMTNERDEARLSYSNERLCQDIESTAKYKIRILSLDKIDNDEALHTILLAIALALRPVRDPHSLGGCLAVTPIVAREWARAEDVVALAKLWTPAERRAVAKLAKVASRSQRGEADMPPCLVALPGMDDWKRHVVRGDRR